MNIRKENLIPLTEEDIAKLKSQKSKSIAYSLIFLVVAVSMVVFFAFYKNRAEGAFLFFITGFMVIFLGIFILIVVSNAKKFTKDVISGKKIQLKGEVARKRKNVTSTRSNKSSSTHYEYFATIDGTEIEVSPQIYKLLRTGTIITLEMGPESKVLLNYSSNGGSNSLQEKVKEEYLSDEEVTQLKKKRKSKVLRVFFFSVLLAILTEIMLTVVLFLSIAQVPDIKIVSAFIGLMFVVSPVFWLIVFIIRAIRNWRRYSQDIQEGVKVVSERTIDELIISNAKMLSANMVVTSSGGDYIYLSSGKFLLPISREELILMPEKIIAKISLSKITGTVVGMELKK